MTLAFLALLAGVALATGVLLLIGLLTGRIGAGRASGESSTSRWLRRVWEGPYRNASARRKHQRLLAAGVGGAVIVWLYSGVPVLALVVALAVPGLPWLLGAGAIEADAIARLQAIESWTRRLRDLVARGMGLQQAIVTSLDNSPPETYGEVRELALRLQAGSDITDSLYAFAADLDDEHADEIIASLIQHANLRGTRLGEQLGQAANDAAAEAAQRQEIYAERANGRMTMTVLTSTLVALFLAGLAMPGYIDPFGRGVGQIVLAVGIGLCVALLLAGRSLNMPKRGERILRRPDTVTDQREELAAMSREVRPV
ncbi:type II secretion system F family protein [Micromonospora sp. DT4]|uniref:type II secretion system F family protein n=1 Tax=Micromonospora sp. DT4 TaxID=3393438 RepID=UPI003CF65CEE